MEFSRAGEFEQSILECLGRAIASWLERIYDQEMRTQEQVMSVLTPLAPRLQQAVGVPNDFIWRLRVEQYHEMIRTGILTEDDPVELLDGWLVMKMPKKTAHSFATQQTRVRLEAILPLGWFANSQEPVTLDTSEPEPDVSVVRGERRQYLECHPGPRDIGMLVEVADSSLERDRSWKKQIYARANVPVYWIVNLPEKQVEVYSEPTGVAEEPDYRQCRQFAATDEVPVVLDGKEIGRIAVNELLP